MVIILSVCLYTLENKKHKAISYPCVGEESLSQSRRKNIFKKPRKKATVRTKQSQKTPKDYLVPVGIHMNSCGFSLCLVVCFERKETCERQSI